MTGNTNSSNFPTTTGAFQTTSGGGYDGFFTQLNASGTALLYSTYLGGSGNDFGQDIAVDSSGNAYLSAETDSTDFPTTPGAFQTTYGGGARDAAIAKFGFGPTPFNICVLYDQTKSAKSGSTVPIKLQLCDANGNDLSSAAIVVQGTSLAALSSEPPGQLEASGNANPDDNFRFDSTLGPTGGYIFNLSTKGLGIGTWGLNFIATGDPTNHQVQFGVK